MDLNEELKEPEARKERQRYLEDLIVKMAEDQLYSQKTIPTSELRTKIIKEIKKTYDI